MRSIFRAIFYDFPDPPKSISQWQWRFLLNRPAKRGFLHCCPPSLLCKKSGGRPYEKGIISVAWAGRGITHCIREEIKWSVSQSRVAAAGFVKSVPNGEQLTLRKRTIISHCRAEHFTQLSRINRPRKFAPANNARRDVTFYYAGIGQRCGGRAKTIDREHSTHG